MEVTQPSGDDRYPWTTAQWTNGFQVATPEPSRLRALYWARRAVAAAGARVEATSSDAFATWTAAVEAVWWVAALDDLLYKLVGPKEYRPARAADDCGRVVLGLRWLRHLHIHDIVVTGAGGPKKPFFPPPGANYFLFISPSNRWLPSDELKSRQGEKSPEERDVYDKVVAGLPLSMASDRAAIWHDRVMSACALPQYMEAEDTTIL